MDIPSSSSLPVLPPNRPDLPEHYPTLCDGCLDGTCTAVPTSFGLHTCVCRHVRDKFGLKHRNFKAVYTILWEREAAVLQPLASHIRQSEKASWEAARKSRIAAQSARLEHDVASESVTALHEAADNEPSSIIVMHSSTGKPREPHRWNMQSPAALQLFSLVTEFLLSYEDIFVDTVLAKSNNRKALGLEKRLSTTIRTAEGSAYRGAERNLAPRRRIRLRTRPLTSEGSLVNPPPSLPATSRRDQQNATEASDTSATETRWDKRMATAPSVEYRDRDRTSIYPAAVGTIPTAGPSSSMSYCSSGFNAEPSLPSFGAHMPVVPCFPSSVDPFGTQSGHMSEVWQASSLPAAYEHRGGYPRALPSSPQYGASVENGDPMCMATSTPTSPMGFRLLQDAQIPYIYPAYSQFSGQGQADVFAPSSSGTSGNVEDNLTASRSASRRPEEYVGHTSNDPLALKAYPMYAASSEALGGADPPSISNTAQLCAQRQTRAEPLPRLFQGQSNAANEPGLMAPRLAHRTLPPSQDNGLSVFDLLEPSQSKAVPVPPCPVSTTSFPPGASISHHVQSPLLGVTQARGPATAVGQTPNTTAVISQSSYGDWVDTSSFVNARDPDPTAGHNQINLT